MNKNELIEGTIYVASIDGTPLIFKFKQLHNGIHGICYHYALRTWADEYRKNDVFSDNFPLKEATPEEVEWLNKCILEDKYIPKDKALNPIPEYVEAIGQFGDEMIGKIYKTSKVPDWVIGWDVKDFWKQFLHQYKESTKEEYEEQHGILPEPPVGAPIEQILEYCKQKFPIGTKYYKISIFGGDPTIWTVSNEPMIEENHGVIGIGDGKPLNGWIWSPKSGYALIKEDEKPKPEIENIEEAENHGEDINEEEKLKIINMYSLEEIQDALSTIVIKDGPLYNKFLKILKDNKG